MTEVISVRFRGGCKNYYFDPRGLQVKMGDQVVVETAQGAEFATCTEGNHEVDDNAIVKPLCAVLRMATESDRRVVEYNRKRESEAFDVCEKEKGLLGAPHYRTDFGKCSVHAWEESTCSGCWIHTHVPHSSVTLFNFFFL